MILCSTKPIRKQNETDATSTTKNKKQIFQDFNFAYDEKRILILFFGLSFFEMNIFVSLKISPHETS